MHPEPRYPFAEWQTHKVKSLEEVTDFKLYQKSPQPAIVAEVELSKVVGTDHDYNNSTWLTMLARMPMRSTDEEYVGMVRDNIDHSKGRQPITLLQYGDKYLIHFGGNHRICHAKFANLHSIKANVQVYKSLPTPAPVATLNVPVSRWAWFHTWVDSWLSG